MKSTGEVYGSDTSADIAYLKARLATEVPVASEGGVYLTVRNEDKEGLVSIAEELFDLGFILYATPGTADVLRSSNIEVTTAYRINDRKHPDALDLMRRGDISFIVNVPTISGGAVRDGNMMRRLAVELNIPFVTTIRGARMETAAIRALIEKEITPRKLEVHYDSKFL
jgi:carbamoyl-phosphate synthase large subunit